MSGNKPQPKPVKPSFPNGTVERSDQTIPPASKK
ncbi:hypothetical protein HMPREF9712_02484 [Myroides odoratimimus CCUG 10230]|uniref:Uncharacterized protein n=1 Tax=Myroides odoratimimus CCUG 10230 TaxID=883150 RepID=A0ABN0E853_9FLAO|nr:hypothetical protein HMPREF9712_02484 [Myroides odoratimimus CCUG 10230]